MAIAAAQLAASSVAAQFATSPSVAISCSASSGASFAPLFARRSQPLHASSRIGVCKTNRDALAKMRLLPIRAAASEEAGEEFVKQAEEVLNDLKAKWDGVRNKSSVAIFGSGALIALWFSSTIVNTINNVPLLPNLMELIGLGYSAWFVYRYLLFQLFTLAHKQGVRVIKSIKSHKVQRVIYRSPHVAPSAVRKLFQLYNVKYFVSDLMDNRKELAAEIKELKRRITGTTDDVSN